MPICIKCEKDINQINLEQIDNKFICTKCLYEGHEPFKIFPIGFIENELERGYKFSLKESRVKISKIHLFESQRPFLYRLEDEEWITIVFYFHKQRQIRSKFSRGIDGKKVGVFASRTPERLSRIGITNVNLIKVEDMTLFVKNLDAINGTPVLDIKLGSKTKW